MNAVTKGLATTAAIGLGGIALGFQGLGWCFSQGHKVATGLRIAADGIDAATDFAENQCNAAADACIELSNEYTQEIEDYENEILKAEAGIETEKTQETSKERTVRPIVGVAEAAA